MSFIEARRHGDVKELTLLLLYSYEIQPCNSEDVFFFFRADKQLRWDLAHIYVGFQKSFPF